MSERPIPSDSYSAADRGVQRIKFALAMNDAARFIEQKFNEARAEPPAKPTEREQAAARQVAELKVYAAACSANLRPPRRSDFRPASTAAPRWMQRPATVWHVLLGMALGLLIAVAAVLVGVR